MKRTLAIDFGADEIRVATPECGITAKEPSCIVYDATTGNAKHFGKQAMAIARQNPSENKIRFPFRGNWILEDMALYSTDILSHFLESLHAGEKSTRLLLSIPCGLSDEEEYATAEIGHSAGFSEVHLVYSPIAALVGGGHSLEKSYFAVNVGVDITDIAIVADSNLVYHASARVGGQSFTDAIREYVWKKWHLKTTSAEAERIKREIGTVWSEEEQKMLEFVGTDAQGSVHRRLLSSEEMFSALEEPCAELLDAIYTAATKVPLESVEELMKTGIFLYGGGSLLRGVPQMIAGITGFPASLAEDPKDAVIKGLAKILPTLPDKLLYPNVSLIACKTNSYLD
ncbi:MAG: rod shape-determining protein [Clostridia bacterium]|nr:rod shape-determining protein [Clostridia bacterium]